MKPSTPEAIAERRRAREIKDMQLGFRFHADRRRQAGMFWVWLDDLMATLEYPDYHANEVMEHFASSEPFSTDSESETYNLEA